jgi:hypothetical protein
VPTVERPRLNVDAERRHCFEIRETLLVESSQPESSQMPGRIEIDDARPHR